MRGTSRRVTELWPGVTHPRKGKNRTRVRRNRTRSGTGLRRSGPTRSRPRTNSWSALRTLTLAIPITRVTWISRFPATATMIYGVRGEHLLIGSLSSRRRWTQCYAASTSRLRLEVLRSGVLPGTHLTGSCSGSRNATLMRLVRNPSATSRRSRVQRVTGSLYATWLPVAPSATIGRAVYGERGSSYGGVRCDYPAHHARRAPDAVAAQSQTGGE